MIELKLTFFSVATAAAYMASLPPLPDGSKVETGKPAATGGNAVSSPSANAKDKAKDSAAPATPPTASPPPPAPKYEESGIGELIQTLVAKDKAAAVALLKTFSVTKGSQLKPEQYAEVKAALEKKHAEIDAAGDDPAG